MKVRKSNMTQETIEKVMRFTDERDWKQFHNPKRFGDIHLSRSSRVSGG